jgi:hypothetical protein
MCAFKMSRPNVKSALKLPEYAMAPARLLQDICRWALGSRASRVMGYGRWNMKVLKIWLV